MNYILIVVVVLLAIFVIFTYNSLVQLRNKVKEAFATMDVYLKKRFDLIPNLVDIVKGYAKHETETLEELTRLRSRSASSDISQKVEGEMKIGEALNRLMIISENYPDLKANENFLDLQGRLVKVEDDIAFSRRYYNGAVRQFNDKCQMFPYNLFASLFGFKVQQPYHVDSDNERNSVNINI